MVMMLAPPAHATAAQMCPNATFVGFTEALPECGAYELVTPAFKDGGASLHLEAISSDGNRILASSLGGYAGTLADPTGAYYESGRSGSGWSTKAISPPASRFPAKQLLGTSADLTRTLWALREPSQSAEAEDLYVREPSGAFVKIGPAVPPSAGPPDRTSESFAHPVVRAGVSPDLSHVLFQIKSSRTPWPADTTVHNSHSQALYEYSGAGNAQPQLVGLDSEGHLLSECGTILGGIERTEGYNAEMYNAISTDGSTVFFTAQGQAGCAGEEGRFPAVNEIYASTDLHPGEPTAISEPTFADCEACQTGTATSLHPAITESNAEFQGASQDGSKAFFLTEQELFVGARTNNLYEFDVNAPAGQKIIRVSVGAEMPEVLGVARVSEDGSHVYFVAEGVLSGENREGQSPRAEGKNLYVFERDSVHPTGRLTFVATLSAEDAADWRREDDRPVQTTPDGRYLVFQSLAALTPGNQSTQVQVFEYDATTEELVRVSVGEAGYSLGIEGADSHSSGITSQGFASQSNPPASTTNLAVSDSGSDVVFSSGGGLTRSAEGAAAAGATSLYEYRSAGSLANGILYLMSDGASALSATANGIDAAGYTSFFTTTEPLVSGDGDTQVDVYATRAHGGFPAAPQTQCESRESCQGPPGILPSTVLAGSIFMPAEGNISGHPEPKHITRKQKLAKALRSCNRGPKRQRAKCYKRAHRKYGATTKRKAKG